ncbi:ribokinase [soil metagenome]
MHVDVAVLGSANLDQVLRVATIPAPGETVLATGQDRHAGGKGLNQAVAAVRAGATTAMIAALGHDDAGDELLAAMHADGIDTAAVRRVDEPSGAALIVVADSGENAIVVAPGANAVMTELRALGRETIADAAVLVAQLEGPVAGVAEAAEAARANGTTVLLNAAPAQPLDDELLRLVDVLVVNEHEAVALGGAGDPVDAAVALTDRVRAVVVTLGADGAAHVDADGLTRTPGVPADAVDTTGAGDTFVGVLAAALATGSAIDVAVRRAVTAGALSVETAGAVPSIPTRSAVDARLVRW